MSSVNDFLLLKLGLKCVAGISSIILGFMNQKLIVDLEIMVAKRTYCGSTYPSMPNTHCEDMSAILVEESLGESKICSFGL